jgi:hypothetical protein
VSTEKHVDLVEHCEKAAQFYIERPGLHGPGAAVDLYQCVADLARRVEELEQRVQPLVEPVR